MNGDVLRIIPPHKTDFLKWRKELRIMKKKTSVINRSKMGWIRKEFDYVRRTFFPGWDRKYKWKIGWLSDCPVIYGCSYLDEDGRLTHFHEERSVDGRGTFFRFPGQNFEAICNIPGKAIIFNDESMELEFFIGPYIRSLMIHEMCHATVPYLYKHTEGYCHDMPWQKKMKKAAKLAWKLGQRVLAHIIEVDVRIKEIELGTGEGVDEMEELQGDLWKMDGWQEDEYETEWMRNWRAERPFLSSSEDVRNVEKVDE
jgi:hypothetical protein